MPPTNPANWLPLAPRDFLILLALSDGPRHGYLLIKSVAEASGGRVAMDPANLYRALKRMHRDGLVTEAASPAHGGGDRRRTYALTPLGRRVVSAEAERVEALAAVVRARRLLPRGASR